MRHRTQCPSFLERGWLVGSGLEMCSTASPRWDPREKSHRCKTYGIKLIFALAVSLFLFFFFSSFFPPPIQSLIHNLYLVTVFLIHAPLPLGHCQTEHKSLLCRGLSSRDLSSLGWPHFGYIQSLLKLSIRYVYGNTEGLFGHLIARK